VSLMDQLRRNSATLVDQVRRSARPCRAVCVLMRGRRQAEMVSRELIRVAILWSEMWHEVGGGGGGEGALLLRTRCVMAAAVA
jgi:hypothetical protein